MRLLLNPTLQDLSGLNTKSLLYERILRPIQISVNKSDTMWNWSFNMPCISLKGILVLFKEEKSYTQDTSNALLCYALLYALFIINRKKNMSKFYNPKIQKVSVTIEGKPNQLYAQGMRSFEQYDGICKYFTEGKNPNEI